MSIKTAEYSEISKKWQYISSAVASFGCVCAGTILAWTSPVLPQLTSPGGGGGGNSSSELTVSENEGGMIGSIVAIGAIIAALPAGYLADKLGRRTTLRILTVPFLVNWLLIWCGDLRLIYLARFLGGFASGAVCVCIPMYVSEIASVAIRGTLGSFFQMSFCLGILVVNCIGAVLPWRQLSITLALFPIAYLIGLMIIPESRYEKLNGGGGKSEVRLGLWQSLKAGKNFRALRVAIGLVTFQQLSGVNAVIFYTSGIFEASGSTISSSLSAIIVAGVQLLFSFISLILMEKFARKFYLEISSAGMSITLLLLGAYFHGKLLNYNPPATIPLLALVLFIISYCAGFGPIPWLMLSELFAADFKAMGCGIATTFNWFLIFVITAVFPNVCYYLGEHITFYLFAAFNLCGLLFVVYRVPETRGKSNFEIQDAL